eukprot:gene10086-12371_t
MQFNLESFNKEKDLKIWVNASETKALPTKADKASCPPCIKSLADGPCGDPFVDSFVCFQTQIENREACAESFKVLRECMIKFPIRYYDALFGSTVDDKLREENEIKKKEEDEIILRENDEFYKELNVPKCYQNGYHLTNFEMAQVFLAGIWKPFKWRSIKEHKNRVQIQHQLGGQCPDATVWSNQENKQVTLYELMNRRNRPLCLITGSFT